MTVHEQLQRWTEPGVFGFYKSCEVTICCLLDHNSEAHNIFTLLTFETKEFTDEKHSAFLTKRNERFGKGMRLVVGQYRISVEDAIDFYLQIERGTNPIETEFGLLNHSVSSSSPPTFVPSNSTKTIPFNRVLKNNFCGGSMIVEWLGNEGGCKDFLSTEELTRLKLRIRELIPIDLFTISDKVGNIIFQLPEQIAFCNLSGDENTTICSVVLDERVDPKNYYLSAYTDFDDGLMDFSAAQSFDTHEISLILAETGGPYVITVVDKENNIPILQQTTSMIRTISNVLSLCGNADSVRTIASSEGSVKEIIVNSSELISVGKPKTIWEAAVGQRRYQKRMDELRHSREFVRYGKDGNDREQALNDLRALMNVKPKTRVCLWDPYLTAEDLLETWYYTETFGLELRAITSGVIAHNKKIPLDDWREEQRKGLKDGSNQYGINLQWRVQHGMFGFSFHDRFLILLPFDDRPKAWSLGTSVNSFGKTHHILQAVSNPGYIADDFEELWGQLSDDSCKIWNSKEER